MLTHRLRKWQWGIFFGWWVLVAVMLLQTLDVIIVASVYMGWPGGLGDR